MLIEKNVVLLGGSNSVMVDGLQKGIRQGIEKFNKELCTIDDKSCNLTLCNLALGITTSMQNFYELKRERNKEILENSELIITESNTNDIGYSCYEIFPLNIFYRNLYWFYQELYFLNKKILVLLLPIQWKNYKIINSIHKKLCQKFGFNFIDLQTYYQKNNLEEFGNRIDALHQMKNIMQELGKNIIKKLDDYQLPKKLSIANDNPNFIICTPKDLELVHGNLEEKKIINSMYNEIVYRINKNIKLKFPSLYSSYNLIAMHTWNQYNGNIAKDWIKLWEDYHSNLKFINKYTSLSKKNNFLNSVAEFHHLFTLDDESVVVYNQNDDADIKERSAIYPNSAR
ncbi:hypothetical protein ACW51F_001656, partial [Campylobacter jejuni]